MDVHNHFEGILLPWKQLEEFALGIRSHEVGIDGCRPPENAGLSSGLLHYALSFLSGAGRVTQRRCAKI